MKGIITLLLFCATVTYGQQFTGKVDVHGFLSQGYIKSSDNNFLGNSQDGSFNVNEIGLTITSQISDNLRLGLQILSYDLGEMGNNEVSIDWAYADYYISEQLGIRVGKVKLPHGFYNEQRDTDILRPVVFLPQSVYDETKRSIMRAYQGIGFYGTFTLGSIGDLNYHIFSGSVDTKSEDPIFQYLTSFANMQSDLTGTTVSGLDLNTKSFYGGNLIFNTGITGLRFVTSYLKYKGNFSAPENSIKIGEMEVNKLYVFGLEYEFYKFLFTTEYMIMDYNASINNVLIGQSENQSMYGMLSFLATDKLTLTVVYDEFYENKDDKDGLMFEQMGFPSYMGYRKDTSFTIRYDFNLNTTLKLEYHDIKGAGLYTTVFNPEGIVEDWSYGIAKVSFSF